MSSCGKEGHELKWVFFVLFCVLGFLVGFFWGVGSGELRRVKIPAWTLNCVTGTVILRELGGQHALWNANGYHWWPLVPSRTSDKGVAPLVEGTSFTSSCGMLAFAWPPEFGEMGFPLDLTAAKPEDVSYSPATHVTEEEKQLLQVAVWLHTHVAHICIYTQLFILLFKYVKANRSSIEK